MHSGIMHLIIGNYFNMNFFNIVNTITNFFINLNKSNFLYIEIISTISGLLCVWLASKEKVTNYIFGTVNVLLFSVIFFKIQLYANVFLQIFFLIGNFYGWYTWRNRQKYKNKKKIQSLSINIMLVLSVICTILIIIMTLCIDVLFKHFTNIIIHLIELTKLYTIPTKTFQPDAFPFLDSCTLVLSVLAMMLMIYKYVETWLIWIFVDLINSFIFKTQHMYVISMEYFILAIMSCNGYWIWKNLLKTQLKNISSKGKKDD